MKTISLDAASFRRRLAPASIPAVWAIALASCLVPGPARAGPAKNVLIIRGESPELPAGRILIDGIESALRTSQTEPPEFYIEAIDTPARTSPEAYEARLANLLEEKYRDTPLDLVVAFTEPAVRFALRERAGLFPNAPLMLGLVDRRLIESSRSCAGSARVLDLDAAGTLRLALRVHQARGACRRVGVLHLIAVASVARRLRNERASRLPTTRIDAREPAEARGGCRRTRRATSMTRDAGGIPSGRSALGPCAPSRAPIYGSRLSLGHRIVSGSMLDLGRHAAIWGCRPRGWRRVSGPPSRRRR